MYFSFDQTWRLSSNLCLDFVSIVDKRHLLDVLSDSEGSSMNRKLFEEKHYENRATTKEARS